MGTIKITVEAKFRAFGITFGDINYTKVFDEPLLAAVGQITKSVSVDGVSVTIDINDPTTAPV